MKNLSPNKKVRTTKNLFVTFTKWTRTSSGTFWPRLATIPAWYYISFTCITDIYYTGNCAPLNATYIPFVKAVCSPQEIIPLQSPRLTPPQQQLTNADSPHTDILCSPSPHVMAESPPPSTNIAMESTPLPPTESVVRATVIGHESTPPPPTDAHESTASPATDTVEDSTPESIASVLYERFLEPLKFSFVPEDGDDGEEFEMQLTEYLSSNLFEEVLSCQPSTDCRNMQHFFLSLNQYRPAASDCQLNAWHN